MESTPKASVPTEKWIALLGRRDTPVDGVEDYCTFLGQALAQQGVELEKVRVEWMEEGWARSLYRLWRKSAGWRGNWVIVQYTAMGWSRRGFPFGVLTAVAILCRRGTRLAIVFHEPCGLGGMRWIDRVRGAFQDMVVRSLYRRSSKSMVTIPIETVDWLPKEDTKAVYVPLGANLPERTLAINAPCDRNGATKTVAVFCLSPGENRLREIADVAHAVKHAVQAGVRLQLVMFGRGTAEMRGEIENALDGTGVQARVFGQLEPDEISQWLGAAHVQLFVCGPVSQRRGSALAGIARGLAIVGYEGLAELTDFEEAGVILVPYRDPEALGEALTKVLADDKLRAALEQRSRNAHDTIFSWNVIAARFVLSLNGNTH